MRFSECEKPSSFEKKKGKQKLVECIHSFHMLTIRTPSRVTILELLIYLFINITLIHLFILLNNKLV